MDKDSVTAALRALATGSKRSKTAQMRDVFDDVDASLKSGVSREDVLTTLNEAGLEISLRTFDTIIYRLRQERLAKNAPSAPGMSETKQPASRPVLENGKTGTKEGAGQEIESNPLEQISNNGAASTGDPRRNVVKHRTEPDKTAIYGKKD